jgi:hypothetical protein
LFLFKPRRNEAHEEKSMQLPVFLRELREDRSGWTLRVAIDALTTEDVKNLIATGNITGKLEGDKPASIHAGRISVNHACGSNIVVKRRPIENTKPES